MYQGPLHSLSTTRDGAIVVQTHTHVHTLSLSLTAHTHTHILLYIMTIYIAWCSR